MDSYWLRKSCQLNIMINWLTTYWVIWSEKSKRHRTLRHCPSLVTSVPGSKRKPSNWQTWTHVPLLQSWPSALSIFPIEAKVPQIRLEITIKTVTGLILFLSTTYLLLRSQPTINWDCFFEKLSLSSDGTSQILVKLELLFPSQKNRFYVYAWSYWG